jgi:hypothetical protein
MTGERRALGLRKHWKLEALAALIQSGMDVRAE